MSIIFPKIPALWRKLRGNSNFSHVQYSSTIPQQQQQQPLPPNYWKIGTKISLDLEFLVHQLIWPASYKYQPSLSRLSHP
jgi:hypothetical protein